MYYGLDGPHDIAASISVGNTCEGLPGDTPRLLIQIPRSPIRSPIEPQVMLLNWEILTVRQVSTADMPGMNASIRRQCLLSA